MRNAHINRHCRRRPGLLEDTHGPIDAGHRRNPTEPSAQDVALSSAPAPWITGALARLSPRHEAAAALGIPTGTVMSRLHRARRRMRIHLTRDHDDWSDHR